MDGLPKAALNQRFPVGRKGHEIAIIKRSEVMDYLTPEFDRMYQLWKMYNYKMGLPGGLSWDQQPRHIVDIIETIQDQYELLKHDRG